MTTRQRRVIYEFATCDTCGHSSPSMCFDVEESLELDRENGYEWETVSPWGRKELHFCSFECLTKWEMNEYMRHTCGAKGAGEQENRNE